MTREEAIKLQIGDWVYLDSRREAQRRIEQIRGVGEDVILLPHLPYSSCEPYKHSLISGIALMPDMLLKNGFIHSMNNIWEKKTDNYEIRIEDEGHFLYLEIRALDAYLQSKICQVHELQESLRQCALDDESNNFKIK